MHRYIPNDSHRNKVNKFILIFFTFLHVSTDPYFSKHETLNKHTLLAIEFLYDSFFVTDHPGKNVQAFIQ
jgi:hypothetical protein